MGGLSIAQERRFNLLPPFSLPTNYCYTTIVELMQQLG